MKALETTQQQILKHHGGDGQHAREMITSTYERRHDLEFWKFWNSTVAKHFEDGDGILDMGAGIGQFVKDCALRYPTAKVYGIEAAPYMLENPLELPKNAEILVDDLSDPKSDFEAGALAMIMANMVVHELVQPVKMFRAAYQWLKPGGRFCIIDLVRQPLSNYLQHRYQGTDLWAESTSVADLEDAFEHFLEHNRYHAEDLEFMLSDVGFELIEVTPQREGRFVRIVAEKPFA